MSPSAMPAMWDLSGRTALVTGAGSPEGIGFATARALAELGARVALTSTTERIHDRAAQVRDAGPDAQGFVADLTDADQVRRLVADVREWAATSRHSPEGGTVDILVNNAGMTSISDPGISDPGIGDPGISDPGIAESGTASEVDLQHWRDSLARNLDSAYLLSREVLPLMRAGGWGRIVMVSSVTGPVMAMRGEVAYAAAKAGMVGLTRALAVDHAGAGITVNAVSPGWIATSSQTRHESVQGDATPMRRSGVPEEIASAVAWLATPGAGYVTGQCVVVDGGNTISEERA